MLRRTKAGVGIDIPKLSVTSNVVDWKHSKEKQLSEDIHSTLGFSNVPSNPRSHLFNDTINIVRYVLVRQICIYPPLIKTLPGFYGDKHLDYHSKLDYVYLVVLRY
jgi:hypothetical protein